jgi:hypothetical protein
MPKKFWAWYSQRITKRRQMVQPSKESFHSPAPAIAPQRATVLCRFPALSAMGGDHLDAWCQVAVGSATRSNYSLGARARLLHHLDQHHSSFCRIAYLSQKCNTGTTHALPGLQARMKAEAIDCHHGRFL